MPPSPCSASIMMPATAVVQCMCIIDYWMSSCCMYNKQTNKQKADMEASDQPTYSPLRPLPGTKPRSRPSALIRRTVRSSPVDPIHWR